MTEKPIDIFSHRKYWAECFGPAPWLPMSRAEMDALGWDSCDIIIITGDAYIDPVSGEVLGIRAEDIASARIKAHIRIDAGAELLVAGRSRREKPPSHPSSHSH